MKGEQMKAKEMTQKQEARERFLERRGYDYSHTSEAGNPVFVLRETRVYVEVLHNGSYRPVGSTGASVI